MVDVNLTAQQIADFLGGELLAEKDKKIKGFAPLAEASSEDLSFFDNERFLEDFRKTQAGLVIVGRSVDPEGKPVLRVDHPYLAFAKVLQRFATVTSRPFQGVSTQAYVSPDAQLGKQVAIGPGAYVGPEAIVGDETEIWPGVYVGPRVKIGKNCKLYPNAVVYHDCVIGDRVILHGGCVIGADGFGYVPEGEKWTKVPQIGKVVIEDDVEVGANTTIDRATLGETRIGRGTKIDNLVLVAHNCKIGENSILIGQVGISGSTTLGKHVVLAGQVGVSGHLKIGDYVQVGAKSGVTKDVPSGKLMLGAPAMHAPEFKRLQAHVRMLPELKKQLKELRSEVENLKEHLQRKPSQ